MRIILCNSILKKELKPLKVYFDKEDIKKYVQKVQVGLGMQLQGVGIDETKLVKIYMTSKTAAGRMIVLVYVQKKYYIPVVIRLKKDKLIGSNLGKDNKYLQILIEKNLDLIMKDLRNGDFEDL